VLRPADLQNALAGHFSKAAQTPVHDVTDWTSMRAWLNNPLTSSLEQDIYKCSNILGCVAVHPSLLARHFCLQGLVCCSGLAFNDRFQRPVYCWQDAFESAARSEHLQ
jgi:hypothetical protein